VYSARTNRFRKAEHYIRILSIYQQPLYAISEHDAIQEGGYNPREFVNLFCKIHHKKRMSVADAVWVIHFEYVGTRKEVQNNDEEN
jgi:hypothetical protein